MGLGSFFSVFFLIVFIIVVIIFALFSNPSLINKKDGNINKFNDPGGSPDRSFIHSAVNLQLDNSAFNNFPCGSLNAGVSPDINFNLNNSTFYKLPCGPIKQNWDDNTSSIPKTRAEPNAAPFVASFLLQNKHMFDGVILAEGAVLTACHNLTGDNEKYINEIEIFAGQNDNSNLNHPQVQNRKIQGYKSLEREDLAIVYLNLPFIFNNCVTAAKLPQENLCTAGEEVISYSFGPNSEDLMDSTAMHAVTLKILPTKSCSSEHEKMSGREICASDHYKFNFKNWTFFCLGDSGSPLIMMKNGQPILVGVLLGGNDGCTQRSPIFKNIFFFKNWIIEKAKHFVNRWNI